MNDPTPFDCMLDAIVDHLEARRARDAAKDSCDHSWGYYGRHLEDEVDDTRKRARAMFNAAVAATPRP